MITSNSKVPTCLEISIASFGPNYVAHLVNGESLEPEVKRQHNQQQQTMHEFLGDWVRAVNGCGGFDT